VESSIDEYLEKTRSVTQYDIANRFGVRMSVARRILRQKEADGVIVPYIREGGLEVYTTPSELERQETEAPIMIADALEEVASSVPKAATITEDMDAELIAASSAGSVVKPSRLARQRREAGAKKEKAKAQLPEVIVEPLVPEAKTEEVAATPEPKPKAKPKAKKPTKKKAKEEAKPKKKVTKKKAEEKPKPKKPTKKKAEEKPKPKKPAKKKAEEAKPKAKKTTKKKTEEAKPKKPAAKKTTTKKAEAKPKKTTTKKTAKKAEEKPKAKKTAKKKSTG
jgi:histone H1/5